MRLRYVFQVVTLRKRKVAEWLAKGKGSWWLKPRWQRLRRLERSRAEWPPIRRAPTKRHRFPAWLVQQGAYWITRGKQIRAPRRNAPWPPPRRIKRHRYPTWLVQQGAYWVNRVKQIRNAPKRNAVWPPPRRAPTKRHRFPAWLVQRGAYWLHRRKRPTAVQPVGRHRRRINGWVGIVAVAAPTFFGRRRKRRTLVPSAAPLHTRRLHRFPAWLVQQGAYWVNRAKRIRGAAKRNASWPPPRRAPTRQHRFPAWLVQRGAYWIHRRKRPGATQQPQRRRRHLNGWLGVVVAAAPAFFGHHRKRAASSSKAAQPRTRRAHRFPSWLVQQGPYWTRRRRKPQPPFPASRWHRRRLNAGLAPPPIIQVYNFAGKHRAARRFPPIIPPHRKRRYSGALLGAPTASWGGNVWWITASGNPGDRAWATIGLGPNPAYQVRLRSLYLVMSGSSAASATMVVRDGPSQAGAVIFEADLYTAANSWDFLDYNEIDLRASVGNVLTVEFVTGISGDVQEINAGGDYVAPGTEYGV